MAKVISQEQVNEYCQRGRSITKLSTEQEVEKKDIVDKLLRGWSLPTGGPWELQLAQNGGKEKYDWRQAYENRLTRMKMRRYSLSEKEARIKAQEEMAAIEANLSNKPAVTIGGTDYVGGVKLLPRPNDAYQIPVPVSNKAVA